MSLTAAVARTELAMLWTSPLPYTVGAALQAVLGLLAADQLQARHQAVTQPLVPIAGFLLLLAIPLLTMRTVADEARTGNLDLLLAIPAPAGPLVAGKWLAAWLTTIVVLVPAGLLAGLLALWGDPDPGPALAGAVGLVLLAGAVAAVGVAASAVTSSQSVAGMATLFASLALWFSHAGSEALSAGRALAALSLSERLRAFAGGGVDTADVAFFAGVAVAALVAAAVTVDLRRLR